MCDDAISDDHVLDDCIRDVHVGDDADFFGDRRFGDEDISTSVVTLVL
jgi:hypothetical protein